MWTILTDILIIAIICCCIVDVSGFIDEMDGYLTKLFKSRLPLHIPKPLSCSTCLSFWSNLVYIIAIGAFSLQNLLLVTLTAMFAPVITDIILFTRDLLTKTIALLGEWLHL